MENRDYPLSESPKPSFLGIPSKEQRKENKAARQATRDARRFQRKYKNKQ